MLRKTLTIKITTSSTDPDKDTIWKFRYKESPTKLQIRDKPKLCLKFSLNNLKKVMKTPASPFLSCHVRTTPNKAAVEGKIVIIGTHMIAQMKLRKRKSTAFSKKENTLYL